MNATLQCLRHLIPMLAFTSVKVMTILKSKIGQSTMNQRILLLINYLKGSQLLWNNSHGSHSPKCFQLLIWINLPSFANWTTTRMPINFFVMLFQSFMK